MPHYRVMIQGNNSLMRLEDAPARLGFYHNHFVTAADPHEAENVAIQAMRNSPRLKNKVLNALSDPPILHVTEIVEVMSIPKVEEGFVWYPDDR